MLLLLSPNIKSDEVKINKGAEIKRNIVSKNKGLGKTVSLNIDLQLAPQIQSNPTRISSKYNRFEKTLHLITVLGLESVWLFSPRSIRWLNSPLSPRRTA